MCIIVLIRNAMRANDFVAADASTLQVLDEKGRPTRGGESVLK